VCPTIVLGNSSREVVFFDVVAVLPDACCTLSRVIVIEDFYKKNKSYKNRNLCKIKRINQKLEKEKNIQIITIRKSFRSSSNMKKKNKIEEKLK
jgi:hypothetical protein